MCDKSLNIMNSSCAMQQVCNSDAKDKNWREDSGLLTDKTHLPAKELRRQAEGPTTHWESSLKCYGIARYHYAGYQCTKHFAVLSRSIKESKTWQIPRKKSQTWRF